MTMSRVFVSLTSLHVLYQIVFFLSLFQALSEGYVTANLSLTFPHIKIEMPLAAQVLQLHHLQQK